MPGPSPTPSSSSTTSSSSKSAYSSSSHQALLKQTSQKQEEQQKQRKQKQKQKASQQQNQQQDLSQCHSCRKRRVRCDAVRPACQKCRDKNITCPGYGRQKPLVWLADGGRQNEYIRAEAEDGGVRGGRKKGRPKMVVAPPTAEEEEARRKKQGEEVEESADEKSREMTLSIRGADRWPNGPQNIHFRVPKSLDLWYPDTIKEVVRTLKYFDERLYPDLNPIAWHPSVHAMDPRLWQHFLNLVIWDVLICVVMTHQTVRALPEAQFVDSRLLIDSDSKSNESNRIELRREVYQYKSRACRVLNQELRNPETQLSDLTLICVLTLLLAETQVSARGDWWTHFQGGNRIIQLRGGLGKIIEANPWIGSNVKYFMLLDVMSATTTDHLPVEDADRAMEYRSLIPGFFRNGLETCVPCPDDMFDAIIRINHLRAMVDQGNYANDESATILRASVRDLLQSILSFSVTAWATERADEYKANANVTPEFAEKRRFILPSWDDWFRIGGAYHSAVLLYCIRSLALDFGAEEVFSVPPRSGMSGGQPQRQTQEGSLGEGVRAAAASPIYVTVPDIHLVAKQTLTNHVRAVSPQLSPPAGGQMPRRKSQPLGKVMNWPIFIAGIEAALDTSIIDNSSSFFPLSSSFSSCSDLNLEYSTPDFPNENLDVVCTSLLLIGKDLGVLNQRDGCAFLRSEWQITCSKHLERLRHQHQQQRVIPEDKRWWTEIFSKAKGRCCFFM